MNASFNISVSPVHAALISDVRFVVVVVAFYPPANLGFMSVYIELQCVSLRYIRAIKTPRYGREPMMTLLFSHMIICINSYMPIIPRQPRYNYKEIEEPKPYLDHSILNGSSSATDTPYPCAFSGTYFAYLKSTCGQKPTKGCLTVDYTAGPFQKQGIRNSAAQNTNLATKFKLN